MLAEHGIGPVAQPGQLCRVSLTVQADPERGGGTAGRGRVQGIRDSLGEFLEPGGQVQVAAEPGAVEALIEQRDLAAQGRDCTAGARVIATGDTAQLGAVEAGGMFRLLAQEVPAARLREVRRFTAEWERQASLRLRDGDLAAVATYDRHGRIRGADAEAGCDRAASMWLADHLRGKDVLLLAGSNAEAAELSRRAQARLTQMGSVGRLLGSPLPTKPSPSCRTPATPSSRTCVWQYLMRSRSATRLTLSATWTVVSSKHAPSRTNAPAMPGGKSVRLSAARSAGLAGVTGTVRR
jgi:hypothetical protein